MAVTWFSHTQSGEWTSSHIRLVASRQVATSKVQQADKWPRMTSAVSMKLGQVQLTESRCLPLNKDSAGSLDPTYGTWMIHGVCHSTRTLPVVWIQRMVCGQLLQTRTQVIYTSIHQSCWAWSYCYLLCKCTP